MKAHTKIMILMAFAAIAAFLVISNVSANRHNSQAQSAFEDIPEDPNNVYYDEDTEPNTILYYPWPPDDDEPNSSSNLNFEVIFNDENLEEPNELSKEYEDPNDPELPIIFDQGTAINSMDPNMPEIG